MRQKLLGIRQVGKASDFDSDIRWFESIIPSQTQPVSSAVEQCLDKALATGSIPVPATKTVDSTAVSAIISIFNAGLV